MSKTTKRKHVAKEVLDDYYVPEGDESIVRVVGGRGNNLHEVRAANSSQFLVSMPSKFRRNVWIKRGDYVIIQPIKEGNKVLAEIVCVLYPKQIKYLKQEGLWPKEFSEGCEEESEEVSPVTAGVEGDDVESESDDALEDLVENPNRRPVAYYPCSSSSGEEDTDGDSSVEGDVVGVDGSSDAGAQNDGDHGERL